MPSSHRRTGRRASSVALFAPTGRDGAVARAVLERAGFTTGIFASMEALCAAIGDDIGVVIIAEEALNGTARARLLATLDAQPPWSDMPIVVLTGENELSRAIPAGLEQLASQANVTLIERPVRIATLVTTVRSALHARRRQLEVRDHLEERLVAEQSMRESESRLRDAVSFAPYPLMLYAEDGEILQLSHAWTALTGYRPGELRTTSDWTSRAFVRSDDCVAAVAGQFTHFGQEPGSSLPVGECAVRTASGAERIWDVHTVALAPLPDGRRLHLTAAVDVTAFKQLLERERFARQQAEEANRAKSDFLTMMSHELRTPLNAIGGYAQILAMGVRGPLTEEQQLDLQRIDKSQRHLLSLINDILNFAKIEAGHVAFDIAPVSVRSLLRDVEPLLRPQLHAKAIRYTDATTGCDASVLADEEKARQILLNLLSNAVKFTPERGIISVSCAVSEREVKITVRDSGIGIAAGKLQVIFEPFVQVARDYRSPQEGTGLGLAISRDLARRMGGELDVESELGAGAAFTLTLPLAGAAIEAEHERERQEA